jgi:transposase-like protein
MKKSTKHKAEEIITILRKVEILTAQGKSVLESCRECSISDNTYYKWRKQYGGMELSHLRELKRLQEENSRLKKAVADLTLDKVILNEALAVKF